MTSVGRGIPFPVGNVNGSSPVEAARSIDAQKTFEAAVGFVQELARDPSICIEKLNRSSVTSEVNFRTDATGRDAFMFRVYKFHPSMGARVGLIPSGHHVYTDIPVKLSISRHSGSDSGMCTIYMRHAQHGNVEFREELPIDSEKAKRALEALESLGKRLDAVIATERSATSSSTPEEHSTPKGTATPTTGQAMQRSLLKRLETPEKESPEGKWQDWTVSIPEFPVDANGMIEVPFTKMLAETAAGNRVTYLGENHSVSEIRDLLQASIGELKKAGVNTLFVECIHQEDNAALEKFMEDGNREAFLTSLGENSWRNPEYISTIDAFRRQGIKVIGIDVRAHSSDFKSSMEERNVAWATKINETFASHPDCKAVVLGGAFHFAQKGRNKSVSSLLPGPVITFVGDRHMDIHSPGGAAYCSTKVSGDIVVNPFTYRSSRPEVPPFGSSFPFGDSARLTAPAAFDYASLINTLWDKKRSGLSNDESSLGKQFDAIPIATEKSSAHPKTTQERPAADGDHTSTDDAAKVATGEITAAARSTAARLQRWISPFRE